MQAILAPQNLRKAEIALYEEIDRVLKEGFTQEELVSRKKALSNTVRSIAVRITLLPIIGFK